MAIAISPEKEFKRGLERYHNRKILNVLKRTQEL